MPLPSGGGGGTVHGGEKGWKKNGETVTAVMRVEVSEESVLLDRGYHRR